MSFNPDPNKQAQEAIFSSKLNLNHASLSSNNTVVIQLTNHRHLRMILDTKLDLQTQQDQQGNWVVKKVTKGINQSPTAYNI